MMIILAIIIGEFRASQICGQINLINYPRDKTIDTSQKQCLGLWTKYIPYFGQSKIDTAYEWDIITISQQISFIIQFENEQFIHKWVITDYDGSERKYQFLYRFSDEYGVYERLPFLHQLCFDREKNSIIFYDYPYNSEQFIETKSIDFIFDTELKWRLEYNGYFYGKQSELQVTDFIPTLDDFRKYVESCMITMCQKTQYISDELITITYNQQNITFYEFYSINEERSFQLGSWVKFIPRENLKSATQQFLNYTNRATSQSQNDYQWNVFRYSIVRLYIVYDSVDKNSNGFIAHTYSYNLPLPGDEGKQIQLTHLSSEYYNQMTSWIFIVFQKKDLDAQLYIYFSKSNFEITVPFPDKIYHFTPNYLYFRISGETRKVNEDFTGQLYYVHTKQCYFDTKPVCHNTCETCSGPLQNHCLTCGDSQITKRVLNPSSMSCDCAYGFISVDYSLDCKVPNQVLSNDILSEIPRIESNCQQGSWRGNNNQCFDCPQKYSQLQNILCGDCYENPNTINSRLVCTFDYIQDPQTGVYTKRSRKVQQYQLYNKNLDSGEIRLYDGVIKICDDGDMTICYSSRYLSMDNQYLIFVKCGPNYYFENSLCVPCSQFCLNCELQNCIECENGYSLYDGQCYKCSINCVECQYQSGEHKCIQCIEKYTNLHSQCHQCGSNTEICGYFLIQYQYQQLALKCLDINKYYLTFTQDCFLNDIEFCLIQYQYSDEINQSSFDIFFKQLPKGKAQTFCALCKPSYINKLTSCEFDKNMLKNDNIVQYQGQTYNIIKMYEKDQLLNNFCEIEFCSLCINNYDLSGTQFCIQCKFGYYPDSISGICKTCPVHCYNCVMQHKIYKDAWKWQIRAFYHYIITSQNSQTFNTNAVDDVDLHEVICTECFHDKEFYDGDCINPCDPSCKKCEKENGMNVCKECYDSILGKQLSISDNKCFNCQDNCKFCQPKLDLDFKPTMPELEYMFRQCLIPYEIKDLFYNNYNFKQCENYTKCDKIINMTLNIYCSFEQLQIDRNLATDPITFDMFNFYYTQIFSYRNLTDFGEIEKLYMLKFYNQIQVDHVYYNLNLMGNQSGLCYLTDYDLMISSKVKNNVFGLKSMNLIISGTKQDLVIENHLMILGFTSVSFKDVNLRFTRGRVDFLDALEVSIVNSQFLPSWMDQYYVEFSTPLAKYVQLKDIIITDFLRDLYMAYQIEIFKLFDSYVHVENITLKGIDFVNITVFKLYGSLFTEIYIKNLYSSSNFYNGSNLIMIKNIMPNILIELEDTYFSGEFDNSCIVKFQQLNNFKIKNLTLQNLKIVNQSILIESQSVKIVGLQILNVEISNSKLYQSFYLDLNNYDFIDLIYTNVTYDQYSQFALILQQQGKVYMSNLYMNNVTNTFTQQRGLTTLFDIQIQNIELVNIYIFRSQGYTEFKLINSKFITIHNITVILDPNFILLSLQQNYECYQQVYQGQYFSTLFNVRNFSLLILSEALFQGAQSVDQPLILIQQISRFLESQQTFINISNSQFYNNQILITDLTVLTSIILIQSDQPGNIYLSNLTVMNSIFIDYIQDTVYDSGLFLITETTYQQIDLQNSLFHSNMIFNSSQSLMRISGYSVNIHNCQFTNQNKYNYDIIKKYLYFSFSDTVYHETIQKMFPLLSQGGSAYVRARVINITDCSFKGNRGIKGGSLFLKTQGTILILNCSFVDSVTQSNLIPTLGGAIYITGDSSSIFIQIMDSQFQQCSSRQGGGAINIGLLDSNTDNLTLIANNLMIRDVISLQGSFLQLQSKQDKQNYLFISNVQITNSYEALQIFFGQLRIFGQDDLLTFLDNNHLFYLDYSYIDIQYLTIQTQHLIGFIKSTNTYSLFFSQILITNFFIKNQQIIDIKLNSVIGGGVFIEKLQIIKINEFDQNTNCSVEIDILKVYAIKYTKCIEFETPSSLQYFYTEQKTNNQIQCILFQLQNITNQNSLFHIYSSQIAQIKKIINVKFQDIIIKNYTYGLVLIENIQSSQIKNNIVIKRITFQNNNCGNAGCLNLKGTEPTTRFLQMESIQSIVLIPQTVIISDSLFTNNNAYQGGAINIHNLDVLINCSIIQNNTASYQGGGIYFIGEKKLNLYYTIMSQNTAFQGGALFLDNKYLSQPFQTELQMDSNKAYQFGQNTAEKPSSLTLQLRNLYFFQKILLKKSEHIFYESIFVPSYRPPGFKKNTTFIYFPSGQVLQNYQYFDEKQQQFLNYNLSLRIIALNQQQMKQANLNDTYCQIAGRYSEDANFSTKFFSNSKFLFNTITKDYNLDDLIIYLDPNLQGYLEIQIACDAIETPIFNSVPPFEAISFIKDYKLFFYAKTFKCQRGEYYNQTQGTCILCDYTQQFYTVIAGGKCQIKNDFTTKAITPARIEIRQGNWRPSETNDLVEQCYHLDSNCQGGWNPGDSSCIPGHIGALCESCDLLNTRGQGRYSQSKQYKCGDCASPNENGLIIFFVSVWTLISILVSVKGTVETIKWTAQSIKLKRIGLRVEIYRENNSSILIKLFISYLLILASITTFQINLPSVFGEIIINIGNPVQSMSYSLDCVLVDMSDISFIYFRVIWAIIMPIIYSSAFLITFILFIILGKASYSFSIISTSLIYIYAYMQPNLIGGFISLISYRNISGILWIQANVAFQYMTNQHYIWIYGFLIPSLTLFGFIVPLLFFSQLYKNKLNLNNPKFRMIWGYMYNEYLDIAYFWEIIKIGQREIIIIFLTFYQDQVVLKSALVFLVIIFYDILAKYYQPYKTKRMNHLDSQSSLVCASSIVSGQVIFTASQSNDVEITWPFYIYLTIVNAYFTLKMIILIIQSYLSLFTVAFEKIKRIINDKYPYFQYVNPQVKSFLEPTAQKKKRIKNYIQKIRKSLMPHVKEMSKFRRNQTLAMSLQLNDAHNSQQISSPKSIDNVLLFTKHDQLQNQILSEQDIIIENSSREKGD